jgi:hypothetical protein
MFYDALVTASRQAEYFALPYFERKKIYPPDTLKLISTSDLPEKIKKETFSVKGGKPGISNQCEALIVINTVYLMLQKYPLNEITVISPYKAQTKLIRSILNRETAAAIMKKDISENEWKNFLFTRISTVDSFQGGESDTVIISYVRSNKDNSLGFTDNHNRINVAHTRCRKEMVIIGDIECLKKGADNPIFERLERSIKRDGKIIKIDIKGLKKLQNNIVNPAETDFSPIQILEFSDNDNSEKQKIAFEPEQKTQTRVVPEPDKTTVPPDTPPPAGKSKEQYESDRKTSAESLIHDSMKNPLPAENATPEVLTQEVTEIHHKPEKKGKKENKPDETSTAVQYIEIPGMAQPDLF